MAKGTAAPESPKAEKVKHTMRLEMPGSLPNMPTVGQTVVVEGKGKVTSTRSGKDYTEAPMRTTIEVECEPGSMSCKPAGKKTMQQIEDENPRV